MNLNLNASSLRPFLTHSTLKAFLTHVKISHWSLFLYSDSFARISHKSGVSSDDKTFMVPFSLSLPLHTVLIFFLLHIKLVETIPLHYNKKFLLDIFGNVTVIFPFYISCIQISFFFSETIS